MLRRVRVRASRLTLRLVRSLATRTLLLFSTRGGRSTVLVSFALSNSRALSLARSSMVLCIGGKDGEKERTYMRRGVREVYKERTEVPFNQKKKTEVPSVEKSSIWRIEKEFHQPRFQRETYVRKAFVLRVIVFTYP